MWYVALASNTIEKKTGHDLGYWMEMNVKKCEKRYGDKFDKAAGTTGCHHLAMAAWNILALMTYDLRRIGDNDIPEAVQLNLFDRVNAETTDLRGTIYDTEDGAPRRKVSRKSPIMGSEH